MPQTLYYGWAYTGDHLGKVVIQVVDTVGPTVTDDETKDVIRFCRWIDLATMEEYVCLDPAAGAAVWKGTTSGGGGGGDHGTLTGLSDDDHAQYILVSGARAFSGNQSAGGFKITSLGAHTGNGDAVRFQHLALDEHTQYLRTDGARALTGNQSAGGFKVTNLAASTTNGDAVRHEDARLSDARTPLAHEASHRSGGGDPLKLDDLAAPDDNTDLDSSTLAHGLLPKLSGLTGQYLDGSGVFSTPPGSATDHGVLTGLLDDDHLQYLKTDGTRALTGNQSAGGFKITNLAASTVNGDAVRHQDARLSDDRVASGLRTASTVVSISGATAPIAGQLLLALNGTGANWRSIVSPGLGFPSGAYRETLPLGDPFPTSATWWTDATKVDKIIEVLVTRDGQQKPTVEQWNIYDDDGSTVIETVTDTITYSGPFEASRTRVIT